MGPKVSRKPKHSPGRPAPFIGREREIEELCQGLERALSGRGQLILLVGEPGIGKTRTAEEIAAEAERRHARVLWGRCYEREGAPAYWPWVQLIRSYLRDCDSQTLREQLGTGAADIAQIVPEIHQLFPDLLPLPRLEPEQSRFRLFDAVTTFLKNAAERQPMVIVLDDLHWADEPSLLLLHFLAQGIPDADLLIVGAYREVDIGQRHELAQVLAAITRERTSHRIMLHGLPKQDVARFIARAIGRESPAALVEAVYQETEGNPFFVTEVVRLLVNDGALDPPVRTTAWRIRIPESVRSVVARRLDRLSRNCHQVLGIAAVVGREFTLTVLEQVSGLTPVQLLNALDEAVQAQLIQEADSASYYRFSHALVLDTLYQRLPTARRAQLHQAVGETIERLHARNPAHSAELAHHFFQATPTGGSARAVRYATLAGDHAMAQIAWEPAVGHYQRALQALGRQRSADQRQHCNLLLELGNAQNRSGPGSGDAPEARASFQQAADIARELGVAEQFAQAAIGFAGFNVAASFGGVRQVALLEEALAMLGAGDSILRVRVLARLAEDLAILSPHSQTRIRTLGDEGVAIARRLGDPPTLGIALAARHLSGWGPDNLDERLADASELVSLGDQSSTALGATWENYWGYINLMLDLVEHGDIPEAHRAMDALEIVGETFQVPYITLRTIVYRTMLLLMAGRFAEAEPLVEQARQQWQSNTLQQHIFQAFALRREQGRLDDLTDSFESGNSISSSEINRYHHLGSVHLLLLLLETGREADARSLFEVLVAQDFSDVPPGPSWHGVMVPLSEACALLEDTQRAANLYDLLLPHAERIAVLSVSAVCLGSVSYYLGLLATTLSRWDDASTHFEQAISVHERMGTRPYAAHSRYAHAAMLAKRDRPGNQQALELGQRALREASSLGMRRLEERAGALVETLTSSPADAGLTPREIEVLRLIAQGLTDAGIAGQLGISPRTVNAHVRSLFSKLRVPSRAAATRAAIEQGLI